MFVSKKSNLNEWKNWAIGFVDSTMSSVDQATSRWFWNLINGLPRDYFAKTFDQVNYLDKRVWEGMFRARIDEIKEQLELGVSESMFEADLVKLQGLVGKYSLSPVTYEDELEELENFISTLGNGDNYLKILREVKNEFREELKSQPALLKECIEGEVNLESKEGTYYKSLLDDRSLKHASPKRVVSELSIPDKAAVSKRGNSNSKLRNISKLLFSNPGQALTLFLAAQSAFASAATTQRSNSFELAVGSDTLHFNNKLLNVFGIRDSTVSQFNNASIQNVISENSTLLSSINTLNKTGEDAIISTEEPSYSIFTYEFKDKIEKVKDEANKLIIALTKENGTKRSKRLVPTNGNETGTFTRPSTSNRITQFESQIAQMKQDIEQLKKSTDISSQNRIILSNLQNSIEQLQSTFDNQRGESQREISNLQARLQNVTGELNIVDSQITTMEVRDAERQCIEAIRANNFEIAQKKLKEINDDGKVASIIEKVYLSPSGFDLALRFGDFIQDIERKFLIYNKLNDKIKSDVHKELFLMVKLVNSLERQIISQENVLSETKEVGRSIVSSLINQVKLAMDDLDYNALFRLASNIKQEMENSIIPNSKINELKNILPPPVKNTVFSSNVCIKNKLFGDLICVGSAMVDGQSNSHFAYLLQDIPSVSSCQHRWKFQLDGDKFLISSLNSKYLTIIDGENAFSYENIITVDAKHMDFSKATWTIIFDQSRNHVYMKHDKGLLLTTQNTMYAPQFELRGHIDAFDKRKYKGKLYDNYLWSIEDCSNKRKRRNVEEVEEQNNMGNITIYEKKDTEENVQPSSHINDITVEKVKETDKSILFVER